MRLHPYGQIVPYRNHSKDGGTWVQQTARQQIDGEKSVHQAQLTSVVVNAELIETAATTKPSSET